MPQSDTALCDPNERIWKENAIFVPILNRFRLTIDIAYRIIYAEILGFSPMLIQRQKYVF